ncbi:MAG: hypothetical protein V2I34_03660 [Bacteroidales bacterium]|jgi:hypothetical protein|nr:hypothetical protein [Bacteroidales bacterium]
MKKILLKSLSVFLSLVLLSAQTHVLAAAPINTGLPGMEESAFVLDENQLDLAMGELYELDSYLSVNEGVTYADLEAMNSDLIAGISDITAPLGIAQDGDPLFGIPAFWWGCILGWVGWLLVYVLTDQDSALTKRAFTGCLISSGASVVLSVLYYFVLYDAWY